MTNTHFRFRNFSIYADARSFRLDVRSVTRTFPARERYVLTSQTDRATDSVLLSIAEGSDRGTDKDFAHFLNIGQTSLNEVVSCFDLALDSHYITEDIHRNVIEKARLLCNQFTAFRRKLLTNPMK